MTAISFPLCSFCGKSQGMVEKIIAGPGVYICNVRRALQRDSRRRARRSGGESTPDDALVSVPDKALVPRPHGGNSPFAPREASVSDHE